MSLLQSIQIPGQQQQRQQPVISLSDLICEKETIKATIAALSPAEITELLKLLPAAILKPPLSDVDLTGSSDEYLQVKKGLLTSVLLSSHFRQTANATTVALRDGGAPGLMESWKVKVKPRGQGEEVGWGPAAIDAYLRGVKYQIEEEEKSQKDDAQDAMDVGEA